jgi:hypothetical protein
MVRFKVAKQGVYKVGTGENYLELILDCKKNKMNW